MKSKNVWMRLLALMLVAGLMLGCLAGCGDDSASGSKKGDSDEKKDEAKAEKLREGLEEHEFDDLLLYFDEDITLGNRGFSNMDGSLTVTVVMATPDELENLEDEYDTKITSAKTLMDALLKSAEEEEQAINKSSKKNGTYYVDYEMSWDDTTKYYIQSFYYQDGYAWVVRVAFDDVDMKDTAVKYATICKVNPEFDPADYEVSEDYGDYNENVDGY